MPIINQGPRPNGNSLINFNFVATTGNRAASFVITSPMGGAIVVDWGDGTSDSELTHTYAANGTYPVAILLEDAVTGITFTGAGWRTPTGTFPPTFEALAYPSGSTLGTFNANNLPPTIKSLTISGCAVTAITGTLPASLEVLDISSNTGITALPTLPAGLKVLRMNGCTGVTGALPTLPAGLTELNISGCTALTGVATVTLPATLTILRARSLALTAVPTLVTGLQIIDIGGQAAGLTSIAFTGTALREFYADACSGLATVPNFVGCSQLLIVNLAGTAVTNTNVAIVLGGIAGSTLQSGGTITMPIAGTGAYAQTRNGLISRGWTLSV